MKKYATESLLGQLDEISNLRIPKTLYVCGNIKLLKRRKIAVVGSRQATSLALIQAKSLVSFIVKHKAVVLSGLAEGVDTIAHRTAIEQGGKTIAVIGTPVTKVYPKQNKELQEHIAKDHLLISQFSPDSQITKVNFVLRNYTIARIADATVIVEASDQSGALYVARETLRQNKLLFIPQSVVTNSIVAWPRTFIRNGAKVLSNKTIHLLVE